MTTVAVLLATSAHAVMVDPSGRGEVLIVPYYTVNGGQQTLLSVVNHGAAGKALKLRFREGRNGRAVLAVNLYLGPADVWTAALLASSEQGEARLLTHDNSCTVPAIKASTHLPVLLAGWTRYLPFTTADFSGARADGGPVDASRTREGFIEIIEMGTLAPDSAAARAATPVAGVPGDCPALEAAWAPGGSWAAEPGRDLLPPSGQLSASAGLLDTAAGALHNLPATALSRFSVVVQHSAADAALPDLSSAVTDAHRSSVESVLISEGRVLRSHWPQDRAVDAVSAALMASTLGNDFNVDPALAARTEWLLAFPTRQHYQDPLTFQVQAPFAASSASPSVSTRACVAPVDHLGFADREGGRPLGLIDFALFAPPNYCRTVQSVVFTRRPGPRLEASAALFGSAEPQPLSTALGSFSVLAGPATLRFASAHVLGPSLEGHRYVGVPVLGFRALPLLNQAARPGGAGIYSATDPHQRTLDCSAGTSVCAVL